MSNLKEILKHGQAKTGLVTRAFFNSENDTSHSADYGNGFPRLTRSMQWACNIGKPTHKPCGTGAEPCKSLCKRVFRELARSVQPQISFRQGNSPSLVVCPGQITSMSKNSHFPGFIFRLAAISLAQTSCRCMSSHWNALARIIISIRYNSQAERGMPCNTFSMGLSNVSGLLHRLQATSLRPCPALKAVFSLSFGVNTHFSDPL